jgi:UDP-N-acetylglucosamine--N-acetylmuramyl-(pentapeptide) pyrophosphoryl-undecaprenol N-acetylglucosamine transferase
VPYLTHDSDALPGLANRIVGGSAVKNLVASPLVSFYPKNTTVVVGLPLERSYYDYAGVSQNKFNKKLEIPESSVHLFVFTGTQGSRVIDDALERVLPDLLKNNIGLYATVVFGRLNEQSLLRRYKDLADDLKPRLRTMLFTDQAADYIASADIVLGRAGATSMAEFATIGRACIIVPADQLTGGHQIMNAEHLAEQEAIIMIRETNLALELEPAITNLANNPKKREQMQVAMRKTAAVPAATLIVDEMIKAAR